MKTLRLQWINYEHGDGGPEVLKDVETPRYPDAELLDKLKFLFFVEKSSPRRAEALRFVDAEGTELARYGAWDEMKAR